MHVANDQQARERPTLLTSGKSSLHGSAEGLAIAVDLASGLLQHVTQVGMHILTNILDRGFYGSIHQGNEVLLHLKTIINDMQKQVLLRARS